jgi:predicted transcriptional regulator
VRVAKEKPTTGANDRTGPRRMSVVEAAELLGITVAAVRGRIKRGTLEAERERTRELQRQLTEVREQLKEERSKGFWARLFGG